MRLSPKLVLAALVLLGLAIHCVDDVRPDLTLGFVHARDFALTLTAVAVVGLAFAYWIPGVGRWIALVTAAGAAHLGCSWLGVPGFVAFVPLPVVLAAAMMNVRAAAVAAAGQTLLWLLLPPLGAVAATPLSTGIVVGATWASVGASWAICSPVNQLASWLWDYFETARVALEEARDRKVQLEQALHELAHANRELELAHERANGLRLAAESAESAKTAFVARVSHELRTPLNMIIGLVDLLVETPEVYGEPLPQELLEDLGIVHRNSVHLSSMIRDVLDLSRADAGQLALQRQRTDLREIVDASTAIVGPLLEKKGLALWTNVPEDIPEVYCDKARIRQVILNLVSNAARFTDKGSVSIDVSWEGNSVTIAVADTGPGIAREDTEKIFEPFFQASSPSRRDAGGSGLGLSISRRFVELHDGQMWLESELGQGSTFWFRLPISPPLPLVGRPGRWIAEDWSWRERIFRARPPRLPFRERVVMLDETGEVGEYLSRHYQGVEFVAASDLGQVREEVRRCPAHAVMVNTATTGDVWPLVDSLRVQVPGTPVIGCCVPPQLGRAFEAGALSYVTKPVTRSGLEKSLAALRVPTKRILVVDDDPDAGRLMCRMLLALDGEREVVAVLTGEAALTQMRAARPDVVLLDVLMPGMDGWQVLSLKNRDQTIRDIPLIFISAQDPSERAPASAMLLAAMGGGLSPGKLLRCSLELSRLLSSPE